MSHEAKLHGWLGTTCDISRYAIGVGVVTKRWLSFDGEEIATVRMAVEGSPTEERLVARLAVEEARAEERLAKVEQAEIEQAEQEDAENYRKNNFSWN